MLRRWLDRERELVSLRNAVGMMSEARRADAAEWHDMREANRELRADALRLRWLASDHADPEVRERVRSICQSMPSRSISGVRPGHRREHGNGGWDVPGGWRHFTASTFWSKAEHDDISSKPNVGGREAPAGHPAEGQRPRKAARERLGLCPPRAG